MSYHQQRGLTGIFYSYWLEQQFQHKHGNIHCASESFCYRRIFNTQPLSALWQMSIITHSSNYSLTVRQIRKHSTQTSNNACCHQPLSDFCFCHSMCPAVLTFSTQLTALHIYRAASQYQRKWKICEFWSSRQDTTDLFPVKKSTTFHEFHKNS